jgi:uncharacterized membrane protein
VRNSDGTIITFSPYEATNVYPEGINARGEIIGHWVDPIQLSHGFVRSPHGTITSFDVGTPGGFPGTIDLAINPKGQSVGAYGDSGTEEHGFLRQADGAIESFDALDATDTSPVAINARGQIVGSYTDVNDDVRRGFQREADGCKKI